MCVCAVYDDEVRIEGGTKTIVEKIYYMYLIECVMKKGLNCERKIFWH